MGLQSGVSVWLAAGWPTGGGTALENVGNGVRCYLSDTSNGLNYSRADAGVKVFCAEHSLDKGGIGDSARERERGALQLRVLLSYHYYRDTDLFDLFGKYFAKPWPDVFLDSGAFSAATQGAQIDLGAYAEWVKHHESLASVYANLDVIGDAEGTARNQRELERRGLSPLPVFHAHTPWAVLEGLVAEYQYVALGGVAIKRNREALRAWIAKCFRVGGDRCVFHGFGLTAWDIMRSFRWYSVDSSSWGSGFRFGTLSLFDANAGKFVKLNLRDKDGAWTARRLIESYGFEMADFAIHERYDRAKVCAVSALSYMRAEQYLRRLHGEVSIPERGPFRADTERSSREREREARGSILPTRTRCGYDRRQVLPQSEPPTERDGRDDDRQPGDESTDLGPRTSDLHRGDHVQRERSPGSRLYLADSMGAGGGDLKALGCIAR